MAKKRTYKNITNPKDVEEILSLTYERACEKSLIMDWFGDYGDGPRFNPYDTITIPKNYYGSGKKKNKNDFVTTIGLWAFNISFIYPFSDILGYINEPVTGDVYDDINESLSYALLEDKITVDQLKDFIVQSQILMSCASAICPSHTEEMLLFTNKAEKKKAELEKQYADGLAQNDLLAMKSVEDGLLQFAKDELKDDPATDLYNSSARSSWGNNFKNMYLDRGGVKHTDGSYTYVSSSYIQGMDPKDFAAVNDAAVGGPYARSRETQSGGAAEKQFTRLTQHIKILPKGSDCGTKQTITVTLTKKNIKDWMYSFVVNSNGSLTELTSETKDKYIGKTVNMRYSSLCKAKNGCMCEACAGSLYRRAGIENAGLLSMVMMSSVKNFAMKKFHSMNLELAEIDPNQAFGLK